MSLELVYAVHDYNAELEDELSLRIGECIAVVEKDEEHNDGWWTGRNSVGQVGLFPLNYTTNVPPSNAPNRSPSIRSAGSIRSSKSIRSPKTFRSSNDVLKPIGPLRLSSVSERPSQANTRRFTDIYLAINTQLSNHRRSRSSSAYSSALSSESNYDGDDTDRFKRARAQLAERARLQLEEARARENDLDLHIKLPSIDTSMYSESDSEDESIRARLFDDDDGYKLHSPLLRQGSKDTLCSPDSGVSATKPALIVPGSTLMTDSPLTLSPVGSGEPQTPSSAGSTAPVPNWSLGPVQPPPFSPLARTPSIISSKVSPPTPVSPSCHEAQPNPVDVSAAREASSSPLAWSISEVQDWLKLWEFSDDVCRKFIEHEVSGEVLLALDDEILKTELGIIPFTLRRQVVTAIADLMSVQPAAPKRNSIILAQPPSPPGPVAASSAAPTVFSARSSSTTAAPLPPTTVTGPLAPRVPVTRPTLRVITSRPASTVRLVPPSPNAQSPEPELPLTPPWSPSPASPTIARSNPLASVARPPATGSIAVNVKPAVAPMAVSTPPQLVPAHGISRISAPHSNVGPSVPPSLMPAALCPTQTLAKPAKPRSPIIAAFMSPPSSSAHNPPAPPARRPSGARRMPVRRQSSYVQPIVADSRYPAEIRLRPTSALPSALTPGFAGGSTSRSSHALAQRIPSNHAVRRIRPLPPISEPFRQSRNAPTSTALIAAPTFLPPGAARPMPPGNRQSRPVPDLYQDVMAAARGVKRERISELPAPVFRLPAQTSSMQGYGIPRALISGRPAL